MPAAPCPQRDEEVSLEKILRDAFVTTQHRGVFHTEGSRIRDRSLLTKEEVPSEAQTLILTTVQLAELTPGSGLTGASALTIPKGTAMSLKTSPMWQPTVNRWDWG